MELSDDRSLLNVPIQVFAGEYRVVEFERASWFKVDLIKQAEAAAAFIPTFHKYFGPDGSLSRLNTGATLVKENGFVLRTDMSGSVGADLCNKRERKEGKLHSDPHYMINIYIESRPPIC